MFLVYYLSMVTVGSAATDWMNDGVFGDGWHLFGIGSAKYEKAAENYGDSDQIIDAFIAEYGTDEMKDTIDISADEYNESAAKDALASLVAATPDNANVTYETEDEETLEVTEHPAQQKLILRPLLTIISTRIIKSPLVLPILHHTAYGFRVFRYLLETDLIKQVPQIGSAVLFLTVL
jgi:hypothetical protein